MNRFRNLTIATKLSLIFVMFAALILAGVGAQAYLSGRAALEQAVISDLQSTANEKQAALDQWLNDRLKLVVSITELPANRVRVNSLIHDDLDEAERKTLHDQTAQALAGFTGPNGNYAEMMIVEADQGRVIVSTQAEDQGKFNEDRSYFIEGKKGPFVQNVIYSLGEQVPLLIVSAPIMADDGSVIAVLAARLKLGEMNEIISRRTGQRETDDEYLVVPSHLYVTQPRFLNDPAVLQRGIHTEQVNLCLAGNSGVIAANGYRGVPVLAVYRWMPERHLCLIIEMEQAEAFAPSYAFGRTLALIALLTLALASLLGFGLARTITHPLQQLVEAAREIGSGKLETRIEAKTEDEVGQLAGAFVQMTENLQKTLVSRDNLFMEVTERKRAEDAIRASELRFRVAAENLTDIIYEWDLKDKVDWYGDIDGMMGFSNGEFPRTLTGWAAMLHPDDKKGVLAAIDGQLHSAVPYDLEYRVRNGNSEWRWWSARGTAIRDEYGNPYKWIGSITDITERKQAKDALLKSEESLRLAVSAGRMGTWDRNFLSGQLYWSVECKEMFGLAPEIEANDERFINALHPEDRVPTDLAIREALEKQADFNMEYRVIWPDGTIHWIASQGHGYYDETGQAIHMTGVTLDITERKQAEETLRQSQENFARAFISSPTALAITRRSDGKFLSVNEAYTKVMGYEPAEILGHTPAEMQIYVHLHERDDLIQQIRDQGNVREYELLVNTKSGEVRNLLVSMEPILYDQQASIISTFIDITKRKQAEQKLEEYSTSLAEMVNERTRELRDAQDQLVRQERLALLGQVAGSIGHELRNPLGVISNAIYFLKIAQPNADDKIKEYLDIIEKEAQTSDKIVTDLLDFARIKSVAREAVSVSDLIRQTLKRFPAPSSIEVTLNLPADLPLIFADPHHVVQVLGNLIVNACQSMGTSGGSVEISAASRDDMVSIAVQDHGMGISPDNMSRLFEPLFTTKAKGIGLGLAISRKLAEANGGSIEVKSEAGLGSTFTVWLPIQRPEGLAGDQA